VDDAIHALKDRVQLAPKDAAAYDLLTRTYFYMGNWDEAAAAAEHAVALEPSNSEYQLWMARAVGEKAAHASFVTAVRMVPKIRAGFERAVQLDGSNAEARTDLAEFYMEAPAFLGGGKDKALAQAEVLNTQDPSAAHWIKGRLAERAKKFDVAEQEYRAAVSSSKHSTEHILDLASFYRGRGRFDEMEEAVKKAASGDIWQTSVPFDAALLLFNAGKNFSGAADLLERYLAGSFQTESAPAYQAHYLLGQIREKQGNPQGAAAEYSAALTLANEFGPAQAALGRVTQGYRFASTK
jgi:tetratricopeptide (TPR) repeat protein